MKELKAVYNKRRGKWRITYTNPGSNQVNAMYDKDRVMIEFDDEFDANLWIFDYYATRVPGGVPDLPPPMTPYEWR